MTEQIFYGDWVIHAGIYGRVVGGDGDAFVLEPISNQHPERRRWTAPRAECRFGYRPKS